MNIESRTTTSSSLSYCVDLLSFFFLAAAVVTAGVSVTRRVNGTGIALRLTATAAAAVARELTLTGATTSRTPLAVTAAPRRPSGLTAPTDEVSLLVQGPPTQFGLSIGDTVGRDERP